MPANRGGGGKGKGGGGADKGGGDKKRGPTRLPKAAPTSKGSSGRKLINLGSKARKAARALRDAPPASGHMVIPASKGAKQRATKWEKSSEGGENDDGGEVDMDMDINKDMEDVDWSKVEGWSKIRYDPNRLIFGASEEGFVELEEIDMKDVFKKPGGGGGGAKQSGGGGGGDDDDDDDFRDATQEEFDFGGMVEDGAAAKDAKRRKTEPAAKAKGKDAGGAAKGATTAAAAAVVAAKASAAAASAAARAAAAVVDAAATKGLSAKDARVAKRKARWKEKVQLAKLRKAEARAEEAGTAAAQPPTASAKKEQQQQKQEEKKKPAAKDEEEYLEGDDNEEEEEEEEGEKGDDAGPAAAGTSEATGAAAAEGWTMDYNNYPTHGMGAVVEGVDLDTGADISNWLEFDLHPKLLRALQDLGFTQPTPIQQECLNPAVKGRCDIIGAAETGSGKTLAFGLPILHRLLTQQDEEAEEGSSGSEGEEEEEDQRSREKTAEEIDDAKDDPFASIEDEFGRKGSNAGMKLDRRRKALRALIIAPTRELAMQVCEMLKSVARHTTISVVPVVGGMSLQKQERLLRQRPEIVVATPGRLWELMHNMGHEHFVDLGRLSFLVLDEADRMVEKGHFAELANIIDTLPMPSRIKRPRGAAKATPETLKILKKRGAAGAAAAAAEAAEAAEAEGTEAEEAEEEGEEEGEDAGGKGGKGKGKKGGSKFGKGGKNGGRNQKGGNAVLVDGDIVGEGVHPGYTEISLRASQMLDRQTFVFSATLTVPDNVRKKLKKRHAHSYNPEADGGGKAGEKKRLDKLSAAAAGGAAAGSLGTLMEAVPFYGRVKLVDLTDQNQTVAKRVMESSLECTEVRLSLSQHTHTSPFSFAILTARV
jgi:ATP-dependent RNA helicase DDX24/MAK5